MWRERGEGDRKNEPELDFNLDRPPLEIIWVFVYPDLTCTMDAGEIIRKSLANAGNHPIELGFPSTSHLRDPLL